jgi:phage baseplate assembly protein W
MPVVRQQVLLLLRTELGSAAHEPEVGLRLPQKMDQSFEQRARGAVLTALEPIGDDIRIDAIPVERIPTGRADITVEYTDLTTGNADTVTL